MALDDDANKVFELSSSCSSDDYDDMVNLYHELYGILVRVKKELKTKIVENDLLLQKLKCLENENHDLNLLVEQLLTQNKLCAECKALKDKNLELT